ncbi:conserved hypothetical protein [Methanosarcina thermophila]|uniref:Uncharacterized protein n=1 Tax=Methanosarcina thermophila TaxID=2210 RepID=A0A3G9CRL2_METTE|nr:conserved hypothetical protein [Methanosarcina thermophila]
MNSNARSIKTRIETEQLPKSQKENTYIRMQDPLKQGLKQRISIGFSREVPYSNARSIKTRIETRFQRLEKGP